MKTITLSDVTQEKFDEQVSLLVDMIRTSYPKLDLRRGTVIRDLLLNPDATIGSLFSLQAEEQRNSSSLARLSERSESGESVDSEDVSAILSNFNMEQVSGTKAKGNVRVSVSSSRVYTVNEGLKFSTLDGLSFSVTMKVVAAPEESSSSVAADATTTLRTGTTGYWFVVPVEADEVGSAGNIQQGTALTPNSSIFGFVSASAYKTFSEGSDLEDLTKTIARIRSSLSIRGLLNRDAVEAQLRDRFDDTENPIVAVSVCGYGNEAQRRDKHNVFGVAVGGRSDVYVRNFTSIPTKVLTKEGVFVEDGVYSVEITAEDAPGAYCVHRVSDPESDGLGSYEYSVEYFASGTESTWHDFDVSKDPHEVCGTKWRSMRLKVKAQPDEDGNPPTFRIEIVCAPAVDRLQATVDADAIRNTGSDFVIRSPMIIQVSVVAVVRHEYSVPFDKDAAVARICEYVNTSGFPGRLTRSEISSILTNLGARSVDLYNENEMLSGFGYDAFGNRFVLCGDALDVDTVRSAEGMITSDTCVFVVEPDNVQITTIPTK